jgi:hypothetical protein
VLLPFSSVCNFAKHCFCIKLSDEVKQKAALSFRKQKQLIKIKMTEQINGDSFEDLSTNANGKLLGGIILTILLFSLQT